MLNREGRTQAMTSAMSSAGAIVALAGVALAIACAALIIAIRK